MGVENYAVATSQIAQTTLRSLLGHADLDTLLAHREGLNNDLRSIIEKRTESWGVGGWRGRDQGRSRFRSRCNAPWPARPKRSGSVAPR